jgi:4-hydroxy 2-oxovalerate aldolase
MKKTVRIIDCTIRDGGHLNKWQFEDRLVQASYFAASRSQVDYFEIGYRNDLNISNLGKYGYCRDKEIARLFKSLTNCRLLCMIDAGKYSGYKIANRGKSRIPFTGIRVAAYPHEAKQAINLIEQVYDKGYEVFLNLMASSEWTSENFETITRWPKKHILEAVYFADSFGSYVMSDIGAFINKLRNYGFKNIGFHSHNNVQMAFANTIYAIEKGIDYVDASIYGMGRGAGNLPIEILLSYLAKTRYKEYNVAPYLDVIERFYLALFDKYKWGYSLEALMSGIKNIHPYYVKEIFDSRSYTVEEIWNILDSIKKNCPVSFSRDELQHTLQGRFYIPTGEQAAETIKEVEKKVKIIPAQDAFHLKTNSLHNRHKHKKMLVIANGPSILRYHKKIEKFIDDHNLVTIGCNYLKNVYLPKYHIFVGKKRFIKYAATVSDKSTLIVPTFFGRKLVDDNYYGKKEYIEIESVNDSSTTPIDGIVQRIVHINVAVSAILTAYQLGAKEIFVAGLDGYEKENDKKMLYFYNEDDRPCDRVTASLRYERLVRELKRIADFLNEEGIPFSIITSTSHTRYYRNLLKR